MLNGLQIIRKSGQQKNWESIFGVRPKTQSAYIELCLSLFRGCISENWCDYYLSVKNLYDMSVYLVTCLFILCWQGRESNWSKTKINLSESRENKQNRKGNKDVAENIPSPTLCNTVTTPQTKPLHDRVYICSWLVCTWWFCVSVVL